jgi:hypothetical protein
MEHYDTDLEEYHVKSVVPVQIHTILTQCLGACLNNLVTR